MNVFEQQISWLLLFSHAGQNYWMLIGWDRAFFLNQEGMITWCWLAEHACIKLVSRFKGILKRNFRNASLLSLILTRLFYLNVTENQHATKRSLLVEKQNDYVRPKTYSFAAWKQFEWGRVVLNEAPDRSLWPPNWKLISSFCYESPYWYYRPRSPYRR